MAAERLSRLDLAGVRRWAVTARAALAERRGEIDDLNVFPVPDGDTGTNLLLTLDAAVDAVRAPTSTRLEEVIAAFARATMESARGNSGVIASQLARGISDVCREQAARGGDASLDGKGLARALRRAHDLARAGVTRPLEGTILTVARAAADGAERVACRTTDLYAVTSAALEAARTALVGTRDQLDVLQRAGVVDAGGAGYVVLLEALERVVGGRRWSRIDDGGWRPGQTRTVRAGHDGGDRAAGTGPAYEVMFLLEDSDEVRVRALRDRLDVLGDSVLVVGGPDVWNAHVHTDDVGAAVEAGMAAGRPHRINVTHFASQAGPPRADQRTGQVAVVACAAGPGLAAVFGDAGAHVVPDEPGHRASAGQLLEAVRGSAAGSVLLLPDGPDSLLAAEAAASAAGADGLDVHVVRARAVVQAIAAMAVFDPAAGTQDNLLAMTGAAAGTRQGAVALEDPAEGTVRGLVEGEVVTTGTDLADIGAEVAERLLSAGGELLTLVTGRDAPDRLAARVSERVHVARPDLEVTAVVGGQPRPTLLLGVE
ncbi:MAG TPA: DAK2 domain-containing protein [Segeticoccus sp.]|uniref:DAK2 domain-containing protein n=1 Tax=Segeticoccus sp. TaxID=2706531 RepID=UPI002D803816|nr:DAK2 domain-containing protein [Segeticoccus sp.]HET8601584.1 DAK2 domain-containing protein [Segeticoccus sp.]